MRRLVDTVLKPANLETIVPVVDEAGKCPLQEWKGKVKNQLKERDIGLRVAQAQRLSSLSDLMRYSDLRTSVAHPYTMSANGSAFSTLSCD